jgi:hypothetical protein
MVSAVQILIRWQLVVLTWFLASDLRGVFTHSEFPRVELETDLA